MSRTRPAMQEKKKAVGELLSMPQRFEGLVEGESPRRGGGVWWRHRKTKCPVEFTMVKTFIHEGEEWNSLRPDIACSCCLSSVLHDHVFILWKDESQVPSTWWNKVKRTVAVILESSLLPLSSSFPGCSEAQSPQSVKVPSVVLEAQPVKQCSHLWYVFELSILATIDLCWTMQPVQEQLMDCVSTCPLAAIDVYPLL